jgi:hypothetical protein
MTPKVMTAHYQYPGLGTFVLYYVDVVSPPTNIDVRTDDGTYLKMYLLFTREE